MRRRATAATAARPWSPRRLRLLLLSGTAMAVLAVAVLAWTVTEVVLRSSSSDDSQGDSQNEGPEQPPAVGAELSAARPGPLTTATSSRIQLPTATELGPGGVPTGYPETPEGALAQLAVIDQTALSSVSIPDAQAVAEEWIADGGPSPQEWSVVRAVEELLTTSDQPGEGSELRVVVEPTMGAFRSGERLNATSLDKDVVTPCVDFVVSLTTSATDQIAAADCQRMTWAGSRWVIDAGPEEEAPRSLWPGSAESAEAGWSWLVIPR